MNEELIAEKASEFEYTDGIYGFKEGVKWVLKQLETKPKIVTDGVVTVDFDKYTVLYKNQVLKLPKKVVQLIGYFITNKGKLVNRDTILKNVWGDDVYVGERTIDVHVVKIKNYLFRECIETVTGVGYRWKC